jgi:glycosyltransferase involved in cell wall biosynthesis
MRPISVLLTNNALGQRGGSETYVRDVAVALLRRGHRPMAFSLVLGETAADLRAATIPVIDDLARLGDAPDVIHGHHHLETLLATLTFPNTPVVNFCHGWVPWEEMPLHHPAVRRYVAVDEVCVDRLVREEGIAPAQVELLLNFVDLERFQPRPPLPARPARALVLSNAATRDNYGRVIAAACAAAGISLDIVGAASGNAASAPEALLATYDLVFAKGRTALEALAVGCATVLADAAGAGPLVTPADYEGLRARNFGIRALHRAHDAAWYGEQIAQFSARGAADVSARVRSEAGLEPAIDRLLAVYAAAIATPAGPGNPSQAAARHCARIARPLKEAYLVRDRLEGVRREFALVRGELDAALRALATQGEMLQALRSASADAEPLLRARDAELDETRAQLRLLREELAAFQALPSLRLRDAVVSVPAIGPALQATARRLAKLLRH